MLSSWLDMPAEPLSGDSNMPKAQGRDWGASERFAVSPGDETNAYLHMPGGQSGHPLSEFYGAGHEDWVQGRATSFLPGVTQHVLTLTAPQ
jgi:penicillin amidase